MGKCCLRPGTLDGSDEILLCSPGNLIKRPIAMKKPVIIVMLLLISSLFSCDYEPDKIEIHPKALITGSAKLKGFLGSIEFYVDGEKVSRHYCICNAGGFYIKSDINAFNNNNDSWHLGISLENGNVGDHNLSTCSYGGPCEGMYFNNVYYYYYGYDVIERYNYNTNDYEMLNIGGNSNIHISNNDAVKVEGTFSGRLCNDDDTSICVTIENGKFVAIKVSWL